MYKNFFVKEAQQELERELAYSAKQWGKRHAVKYANEIRAKIRTICKSPQLYPFRNDILPEIRICPYKGNRIIYTVLETKKLVIILAVLSTFQEINSNKLAKRQKNIFCSRSN